MGDDIPTEASVLQALLGVLDPEIGESIVNLGLVGRIEIGSGRVHVVLIPTSATCPMSDLLLEESTNAVKRAVPDGVAVSVMLDWNATWDPTRMSPEMRSRFGW